MKRFFAVVLTALLLLPLTAMAEVSNREMQLMGGVVVSNASDAFFFAPLDEGSTHRWGLYALSSAQQGPIAEITDGNPARLIHADDQAVYYMGYTDEERTICALYGVSIASGTREELETGIAGAFVGESDVFLYVKEGDAYTLWRYDIPSKKASIVKDMSNSGKTIYDATMYDGQIYFLTMKDGVEDGYEYHDGSGKATNLDRPTPQIHTSILYDAYRIYANDAAGSLIYAAKIGGKEGVRLGQQYPITLNSYRYGELIYLYDATNNALVGIPLDGSAEKTLTLQSPALPGMILGSTGSELLLMGVDAIYSISPDLSTQTSLFPFDITAGGKMWGYVAPAGDSAILTMGYDAQTVTYAHNMMPTSVYAYSRSTGELLFGFPSLFADTPDAPPEDDLPPQDDLTGVELYIPEGTTVESAPPTGDGQTQVVGSPADVPQVEQQQTGVPATGGTIEGVESGETFFDISVLGGS